MSYQNERDRILKMRLAREQGRLATTFDASYPQANVAPVQPSQYSEVEEYMARHYEDEAMLSSGLIPGIIHDRRGVWEGLDARNIAQRTAQIGLYRANGFNRGNTHDGESLANNPLGQDDNVRVFDKNPVPPGEYYSRPLSVMFDRVAMESALITMDMGFPFYAEYRNNASITAGSIFALPGAGATSTLFNHNAAIERIVVINDSAEDIILAIDQNAADTPGAPGTGNGQFLVKGGESNTYPIRCYQFIELLNAGSGAIAAEDLRVQVYGYKDSNPYVLSRTARPEAQAPAGQNFSNVLP
jgi:hypothetical protein